MSTAPRMGCKENCTTTAAVYSHSSLAGSCLVRHIENSEQILTVEAKKMRRSFHPAGKQANIGNENRKKPNASEDRSKNKISKTASLDNGTMVEAFKYLNYCQLAKNSLVSMRFCNVIQTHRHKLALLYVRSIDMVDSSTMSAVINIFDIELSSEAYNEWVNRNNYSRQLPLEYQVSIVKSTQNISKYYWINACSHYKDSSNRKLEDRTTVFSARVKFNHENWPLFQHFVRLLTDSFIYIDCVEMSYQNNVLDLLAKAMNSDHHRLQCKEFICHPGDNSQKFIAWAKNHVHCNKIYFYGKCDLKQDEAFLDFVVTGAPCTSEVHVTYYDISKAMVDFVQKFLDLKNWDEYQCVQYIESSQLVKNQTIQVWMKDYAKVIVKEEHGDGSTSYVFEFTNNAIGKKLQLTATIFDDEDDYWFDSFPALSMEIKNL